MREPAALPALCVWRYRPGRACTRAPRAFWRCSPFRACTRCSIGVDYVVYSSCNLLLLAMPAEIYSRVLHGRRHKILALKIRPFPAHAHACASGSHGVKGCISPGGCCSRGAGKRYRLSDRLRSVPWSKPIHSDDKAAKPQRVQGFGSRLHLIPLAPGGRCPLQRDGRCA